VLVVCGVSLLFALWALAEVARMGKDAAVGAFCEFLAALFVFLAFLLLAISMVQLPAAAPVDQLLPYYLGAWSFVGLHAFCMVFALLRGEYFQKRVWAIVLPVLGTLSYLALVWMLATPSTVGLVFDGVLNYVAMPLVLLASAGVLLVLYILVIPLFAFYALAKQLKGAQKQWTLSVWFGFLVWAIAALLFVAVQFAAFLGLVALGLAAFAWVFVLVSAYLLDRQSKLKLKAESKPKRTVKATPTRRR
jgi:hypothetical protein